MTGRFGVARTDTSDRGWARPRRRLSLVVLLALVAGTLAMGSPTDDDALVDDGGAGGGPPLVFNGSFEAPDVSAFSGTGGATVLRSGEAAYRGARSLAVESSRLPGSGVATETVAHPGAGLHVLTLAVKGTANSSEQVVQAVVTDVATGRRTTSAPVHLTPWWQTVAVSAMTSGGPLRVALEEIAGGGVWSPGDRYLVDVVDLRASTPTPVNTAGRQLMVDGTPFVMKGYVYMAAPPGGFANLLTWNTNPAQCQSDAQLLQAAGVNTLRIWYQEAGYEPTSYQQCMDAFHGAGIKLMWLIQPPGGLQTQEDDPAYVEAYWEHLRLAVERVKGHPATMGYNIGNEMKRTVAESNGWFPQVDELARRVKQIDPLHVTTTTMNDPQFFGFAGPGGDGVGPADAPNLDLWGLNHYGTAEGLSAAVWDRIVAQDPTRPVWISEFGTDRYRCNQDFANGGIFNPLWLVLCGEGSGEDQAPQAQWNAAQWEDIAANLSADDPDAAVVGGTLFMWSDVWWFAFPIFTGGVTSPVTHEVQGLSRTNPVNGEPNHFVRAHFPDQHFEPEWIGSTLNLTPEAPGPRVTSLSYDRMSTLYTGVPGPAITVPQVEVGACSATLSWSSDVPTFARADYGRTVVVLGPDNLHMADNFLADHWSQDAEASTVHEIVLTGLVPGQDYRAHVRGFDDFGRSGTQPPVEFTTAAVPDATCGGG